MSAVAMATTATAATRGAAGIATAPAGAVAGTGGGEHGEFLRELYGAAMRTAGAFPVGRTHEDFAVAFTVGTMKFVDWHAPSINPSAQISRSLRDGHLG